MARQKLDLWLLLLLAVCARLQSYMQSCMHCLPQRDMQRGTGRTDRMESCTAVMFTERERGTEEGRAGEGGVPDLQQLSVRASNYSLLSAQGWPLYTGELEWPHLSKSSSPMTTNQTVWGAAGPTSPWKCNYPARSATGNRLCKNYVCSTCAPRPTALVPTEKCECTSSSQCHISVHNWKPIQSTLIYPNIFYSLRTQNFRFGTPIPNKVGHKRWIFPWSDPRYIRADH